MTWKTVSWSAMTVLALFVAAFVKTRASGPTDLPRKTFGSA